MIKSNSLYFIMNLYPMLIHMMFIFIMSIPSKKYKFNPITLTFMLILLTLMITLKMNLMLNSWSSFILFLIMIGGLMIIFMYITSLTNNMLFMFNYKMIFMNFLKVIPLILIMLILNINFFDWYNSNIWLNLFNNFNLNFYEIYENFYKNNSMFIMNYLFYSMICIMNICYKFKLPLRQLYI